MNPLFLKREGYFLIILILFSAFLYFFHWYLISQFFDDLILTIPLYSIYIFHAITVFIVYSIVNFIASKGSKQVFPVFMGATLFKMVLAIVFLLPVLLNTVPNARADVFNFFIPYFLYLAFEIVNITFFLKDQ